MTKVNSKKEVVNFRKNNSTNIKGHILTFDSEGSVELTDEQFEFFQPLDIYNFELPKTAEEIEAEKKAIEIKKKENPSIIDGLDLSTLSIDELREICVGAELPESEWQTKGTKAIIKYITSKLS